MSIPQLYVIAGPNGAGKSTFSDLLTPSHVTVIDGDKELTSRQKAFPDIDAANLLEAMNEHWFPALIENAILHKTDFAYETNLRSDSTITTANRFRKNGYETNLIYIGLTSVENAVERVRLRVKSGGHHVTLENIAYNYQAGLDHLKKCLLVFDRVAIFDNSSYLNDTVIPQMLYKYEKGKVIEKAALIPLWIKDIIP